VDRFQGKKRGKREFPADGFTSVGGYIKRIKRRKIQSEKGKGWEKLGDLEKFDLGSGGCREGNHMKNW